MIEVVGTPTLQHVSGSDRYRLVRGLTEALALPLSAEDQTVQSMPDASPVKWHRAHTSWFFETFVLSPHSSGFRTFDPAYGFLFNSYYEGLGDRYPRARRGAVSRPGVEEIGSYRHYVDQAMTALLEAPLSDQVADLLELGLHHENQHQELLLMDVKHMLSCSPLQPAYAKGVVPKVSVPPRVEWIHCAGGIGEVGFAGEGFAFDNEAPRHTVWSTPFEVASRPVTCGDWLEFIDDGGYARPELWLSDGWAIIQAEGWTAPLYWSGGQDEIQVFTLLGPRSLDPGEPVCHVSYYEADAYARWSGARLPTEFEWEVASNLLPVDPAQPPKGLAGSLSTGLPAAAGAQAEVVLHPRPVDRLSPMLGDVWQWTSSAYAPYPGFRPAPGAVGEYNGKFMVNQYVLRGGSCVTPAGHVRPTYRNYFPPSARWPFAGLRLARDASL